MLKSFDEVMKLTSTLSEWTVFDPAECKAYYDLLVSLPDCATVVEIGLQFGRSSSIVAQVSEHKHFSYIGIDSLTRPPESYDAWLGMMRKIGVPFTLMCMDTKDVQGELPLINLALIDGDHSDDGLQADWNLVGPQIVSGGYICFHDYGWSSTPNVKPMVKHLMQGTFVRGLVGWSKFAEQPSTNNLGVWQSC